MTQNQYAKISGISICNNELSERNDIIPFTSKRVKYLGINLTNELKRKSYKLKTKILMKIVEVGKIIYVLGLQ